ncbi:MAG: (d)CMP kinase [Candidatus Cloacimonetes bacterium]|nr:(d)CMP kinase [Candidatus Cloacimonadota bacterium]
MGKSYIIAIDGPASSGKSTTAKALARRLEYVYIDTGAMYRACALRSLKDYIVLNDESALQEMLSSIQIDIRYQPEGNQIFLDGEDVSERIREEDISRLSSQIATIGIVRTAMVTLQQEMGSKGGVVMDGRDIGTVVFPDADFKFFMTANLKTRAERRYKELKAKGKDIDPKEVEKELRWRDANDTNRAIAPLRQADDAIVIDTSGLTIEKQTALLWKYVSDES